MNKDMTVKEGGTMDVCNETARPDDATTDGRRLLTSAAERALAEAAARRDAIVHGTNAQEIDGRGGLDPIRYGDWEIKGLTSDF